MILFLCFSSYENIKNINKPAFKTKKKKRAKIFTHNFIDIKLKIYNICRNLSLGKIIYRFKRYLFIFKSV